MSRTCIYDNGDVLQSSGDCPDPYEDIDGNPIALVDWSDTVIVTTTPPTSMAASLLVAGILLMLFFGDN